MRSDMLIIEDLMLLMLDDKTGVPAGAGTLYYTLGGAVLLELALLDRIEADEGPALNGPKITTVGDGPLADPLLQSAYDKIAEKTQRVQPLLNAVGSGLYQPVIERLLERGHLRQERRRVLGLFPTTRLPAEDNGYEAELRRKVCAVLEDGESPDPHLGAVIALLSASGTLPTLDPAPKWSSRTYHRAKELEQGSWAAGAVNDAVARTVAAIAAGSAAVSIATITGPSS
ncbi:GOLPH3/VPS74 family protein [Actinoalloteichus sp. GBA129-24]|uniref:GOLPH3/VPS74 family protein n=1 Tax=Actinoalloteichus sp. GBA129-24 TaxID=1612551 RepID=UPI000950968B|nr:GPP34 family phosphoprotein [Actinoalloteichus sp. GBA129-24]APU22483.1 Golgi phosphoprotein 3 (GPP34) [Actinoalloteichus sp. GBA129-24]